MKQAIDTIGLVETRDVPPIGENTPINQLEIRGWEVAQLQPNGSWKQVAHYQPGGRGEAEAKASAKWLNGRGHKSIYAARVLVSAEEPRPQPLVLDADESAEAGGGLTGVATDFGPSPPSTPYSPEDLLVPDSDVHGSVGWSRQESK